MSISTSFNLNLAGVFAHTIQGKIVEGWNIGEWAACIATTNYKTKYLVGKNWWKEFYLPNSPSFPLQNFPTYNILYQSKLGLNLVDILEKLHKHPKTAFIIHHYIRIYMYYWGILCILCTLSIVTKGTKCKCELSTVT